MAVLEQRLATAERMAHDATVVAQDGVDKAVNARQMVLNDRPKIATLETQQADLASLAATLGAAIPAADATHAAQWAAINDAAAKLETLLANKTTVAFGSRAMTGSLLAGATTNVVVTFDKTLAGTDYSLGYSLEGGTSLLGQLVIGGVVGRATNSATIQVRNTGLTAVANLTAATVHVVAARVG